MNPRYLFLFGLLSFLPTLSNANNFSEEISVTQVEETSHMASYLTDLEEKGYCVISQVVSTSETEVLYQRVWHEFIEKAWPNCRLGDRSNWKDVFPMHNKMGIFAGPAGQTQVLWDLRQDPRIIDVFAALWNTKDLIVSMDGLSLMCPSEIRQNDFASWPHVDQAVKHEGYLKNSNSSSLEFVSESKLKTEPYTIQGQFLFEDSSEGDGGFYCIPKSHLRFKEFALKLESINALNIPQNSKYEAQQDYLKEFFKSNKDKNGNPYEKKHITAPRGSLILWDSRTVHWNQSSKLNRPYNDTPKVRMVGYLCYVPKSRLTDKGANLRRMAFENGTSTNHNPACPELKYSKDHAWKEFEHYLEDPKYVQPKIHLTDLGKSLLGF